MGFLTSSTCSIAIGGDTPVSSIFVDANDNTSSLVHIGGIFIPKETGKWPRASYLAIVQGWTMASKMDYASIDASIVVVEFGSAYTNFVLQLNYRCWALKKLCRKEMEGKFVTKKRSKIVSI
jgi:hypothetical protein